MLLMFLAACSTYSPSRGYPSRSYSYQPQNSPYHSGHGYYQQNYYYGSYQPGWFVGVGYPGAYYGGWGYGPVAYWPTYSYAYYRNSYYPYYDPWYYSHPSYYRNSYGYGSGHYYGNRPYYGGTHSYRPPGHHGQPNQNRPDPVVIPPGQRGRRGGAEDYNDRVAERLRQNETRQPDRRSTTVVTEEQGMSRSVSLAPTQDGDQGMTISSRSERKIRPSRLEPIGIQPEDTDSNQSSRQRAYGTAPVQPADSAMPVTSIRGSRNYGSDASPPRGSVNMAPAVPDRNLSPRPANSAPVRIEVPPTHSEHIYRQAPPRDEPAYEPPAPRSEPVYQQPAPRSEPNYQQQLDSRQVEQRDDRRRQRDPERDQERRNN